MKKISFMFLTLILVMLPIPVSAKDMFDPEKMVSAYNDNVISFFDTLIDGSYDRDLYRKGFSLIESYSESTDSFTVYRTSDDGCKVSFANDRKAITFLVNLDSTVGNIPCMIFAWTLLYENYYNDFDLFDWMNVGYNNSMASVFEGDGFIVSAGVFKNDRMVVTIIKNDSGIDLKDAVETYEWDKAKRAIEEAPDDAKDTLEDVGEKAEDAVEEKVDEFKDSVDEFKDTVEEETNSEKKENANDEKEAAILSVETEKTKKASPASLYPDGEGIEFRASSYNPAAPDWAEYTDLIVQIKSETNLEARTALMHKAEDILMATGAVVPIYYYNDLYLQKTDVEGIYSNLFGFKFFQFATSPRDVLKINLASEPAKIDPALNSSVDGACLDVNLFAGLYTYDAEGALQPDLADPANPYEVSEDGTVYTFHLLDGIKWSDGSDVTARDFEYAWKRCADPKTAADYAYMFDCFALNDDGSIKVEATDDKTLVATLNGPCAYFLDLCAFPAYLPVPQAQVEAQSDWEINPGAWCAEAGFITNGAYTVKEWKHEESMIFVKNPNYHRADEVTIEEIDFMLSADDTAIYAAYQSDDLDFADTVPTNEIANIKGNEDFHVVDNLGTYYAAFNVNSPIFEGKTVDQAVAMRKAFSLLIDRQYIVDNIGQTEQKVASSYIPAGMADGNGGVFKENNDTYTFPYAETEGYYPIYEDGVEDEAIDEARELLKEAGYEFTEDGVLSDKTPINITYLTNESTGHVAIAESMQQDFDTLGIKMSIETREWNVFLDERKNGNFDFAREGWLADFNDPINMLEMWTPQSGNNDCQFGRDSTL